MYINKQMRMIRKCHNCRLSYKLDFNVGLGTKKPVFGLVSQKFTFTRLGMSVTTQGGSGRQCVTGPGRNISK